MVNEKVFFQLGTEASAKSTVYRLYLLCCTSILFLLFLFYYLSTICFYHSVSNTEDAFRKELEEQKMKYIQEIEELRDQSALAMELTTARVKGLSEALTGAYFQPLIKVLILRESSLSAQIHSV